MRILRGSLLPGWEMATGAGSFDGPTRSDSVTTLFAPLPPTKPRTPGTRPDIPRRSPYSNRRNRRAKPPSQRRICDETPAIGSSRPPIRRSANRCSNPIAINNTATSDASVRTEGRAASFLPPCTALKSSLGEPEAKEFSSIAPKTHAMAMIPARASGAAQRRRSRSPIRAGRGTRWAKEVDLPPVASQRPRLAEGLAHTTSAATIAEFWRGQNAQQIRTLVPCCPSSQFAGQAPKFHSTQCNFSWIGSLHFGEVSSDPPEKRRSITFSAAAARGRGE